MVLLQAGLLDPRKEVHMVEIRGDVVVGGELLGLGTRILQIFDGRIYLVVRQLVIRVRRVAYRSTNRRGNEGEHGRRNLFLVRLVKE